MVSTWLKAAVTAVSTGVAFAACSGDLRGSAHAIEVAAAAAPAVASPSAAALPDFSSLVEQYGPAVVNVTIVGKRRQVADIPGFAPGDPFGEFFRRFGQPIPRGQIPPPRGEGSGFIVSEDGYILTNAHVVAEAEEVTVKTTDRREYSAKIIGLDENTDVAVLKIDAKNLPTVKIGDPSKLKPGEWVIAIGSPFGFENSVTAGIVSATARAMPVGPDYRPQFIQTDVAVNPGNSGGPLFNMRGEVVGINSQIYSRTGGYMGLSFSIPIDVAMKVADDLRKYGKVERGRMGVTIQSVNRELAESFGLDRPRGALVSSVEAGSPAEKAGVKPGDIILSASGRAIEESADLPRIVGETRPGETIPMEVWRNGEKLNIKVTVARMPDDDQTASPETPSAPGGKLGIAVRALTPEERKQAKVDGGVVIERIGPGPAASAGLRQGDVILAFNNAPVNSPEDLAKLTAKAKGVVAVLVLRENSRIYVPITLK